MHRWQGAEVVQYRGYPAKEDGVRLFKQVYIAGPYRSGSVEGLSQNIYNAALVRDDVIRMGCVAVCPHVMFNDCDVECSDRFWLAATQQLMLNCDAVVLVDGWERSHGTRAEVVAARQAGIPVFEHLRDLEDWVWREDVHRLHGGMVAPEGSRPSEAESGCGESCECVRDNVPTGTSRKHCAYGYARGQAGATQRADSETQGEGLCH